MPVEPPSILVESSSSFHPFFIRVIRVSSLVPLHRAMINLLRAVETFIVWRTQQRRQRLAELPRVGPDLIRAESLPVLPNCDDCEVIRRRVLLEDFIA